jgi:hypothetical protein
MPISAVPAAARREAPATPAVGPSGPKAGSKTAPTIAQRQLLVSAPPHQRAREKAQNLEGPEGAFHNHSTSLGPCPSNESVPSRASELQRTRTLSSSPSGRDFGNALLTLLSRLLALYVSCVVLLRIYQVRGGRGSRGEGKGRKARLRASERRKGPRSEEASSITLLSTKRLDCPRITG